MKDKFCRIGEQHLRYNLNKCNKKGSFDILNDISENIHLVKLMDTLVNLNHAIMIVRYWIFDSNYEEALHDPHNSQYSPIFYLMMI